MNRPSWDEYFLNIAKLVSSRSNDSQTRHGCVIVDKDNHIIGTGYNSFPKGMRDNELPNTRPEKYDYVVHSEVNCLLNCVVSPVGSRAYVTGQCCNHCCFCLHNAGVEEIIMAKAHGSFLLDEKQEKIFKLFCEQTGIKIRYVDTNFDLVK